MSELWTAEAMVAAMEGRPFGQLPKTVSGISIDTRTLNRGEAFFAIKGESFDGHDFATAAVAAGAALLVVAEGRLPGLGRLTCPMIVVPPARRRPRKRSGTRYRGRVRCTRRSAPSTIIGACR
jgi:UDP-N-acetylmuramoyl-tripeptide--D-alanyl-D-alanine ligase